MLVKTACWVISHLKSFTTEAEMMPRMNHLLPCFNKNPPPESPAKKLSVNLNVGSELPYIPKHGPTPSAPFAQNVRYDDMNVRVVGWSRKHFSFETI